MMRKTYFETLGEDFEDLVAESVALLLETAYLCFGGYQWGRERLVCFTVDVFADVEGSFNI